MPTRSGCLFSVNFSPEPSQVMQELRGETVENHSAHRRLRTFANCTRFRCVVNNSRCVSQKHAQRGGLRAYKFALVSPSACSASSTFEYGGVSISATFSNCGYPLL